MPCSLNDLFLHISRKKTPCARAVWENTSSMACANPGGGGSGGDDPNDPFDPPQTPRMVLKDSDSGEELTPDTEQHVAEETDGVFR